MGTFALTFVAAGADVITAFSGGAISSSARVVAPALLVMAMIYTLGSLSGAHFNPAVTLAFALRKDFLWRCVPGYWVAQLVGAVLAALLLRLFFGDDLVSDLKRAIDALPAAMRSVVCLRCTERLPFSQIGQALHMPETTAKTYFHRGRARLRTTLATR